MIMDSGTTDTGFVVKIIVFALLLMFLVPLFFSLFIPQVDNGEDTKYAEQIQQLENEYYLSTGRNVTATTETWALTGIYEPFYGSSYGITDDGWIFGARVTDYSPAQYTTDMSVYGPKNRYAVIYSESDGLYYYSDVDTTLDKSHTPAQWIEATETVRGHWDFTGASLYTAVSMDNDHPSDVFFTPGGKTNTDKGFYYEYTGYRYAFQPLRPYHTYIGGIDTEVEPNSTSLSLIWYQYSSMNGIAGQLTISGNDSGLSYLSSTDILREFNQTTYSSTFDLTFNNVAMHLTIRLDPIRIAEGKSVEECYNQGWWSVIVSSDAIVTSSLNDASYDFNPNNVFDTLIKLLTFRIAEDYDIEGWQGIIASLLVTMPLYASLMALALIYPQSLILVAILGAIQAVVSIFSGWHW